MHFSIIIPMLNEMAAVPDLLEHLLSWQQQGCEILLVDGGSSDGGDVLAEAAGFRVLRGPVGRARQMNLGASVARGEVLIFLHADTRLPARALVAIHELLGTWKYQWGRFDVRLSGQSPLLKMVSWMMNLRSLLTGIATGDQAIFVRRSLFLRLRGFPDQAIMEDIAFSKLAKQSSRPACLSERVTSSGRRWEKYGIWRTIFLMWRLRWRYWRGEAPDKLAAAYRY